MYTNESAVVVHLGTMVGGHYIAYCLVDPEKMFGDEPMPTDLDVEKDGINNIEESRPEPIDGAKKDRRVWCFCSE
jgi:ubiquitin carboxyl-terminal hydrolase 16/45